MGEAMTTRVRVLAVDDEPAMTAWMQVALETNGFDVRTAGNASSAEEIHQLWHPDLVLLDLMLPDADGLDLLSRFRQGVPPSKVIVISGRAKIGHAVDAMHAGACTFLEKPLEPHALLAAVERAAVERATVERAGVERAGARASRESAAGASAGAPRAGDAAAEPDHLFDLIGTSPPMHELFDQIRLVAPTEANVLIVGENGTGKELVATAIHRLSRRATQPFVRINCAAIPCDLIESELFGYKRGAFTGAMQDKVGLFEAAAGGSLLLDEIAEMPPALQVKLLRVLQEREFRAVGGQRTVRANFRLVCSTNASPEEALASHTLREDLYFRINTLTMRVPPLRERPDDIVYLAHDFLQQYAAREQRDVQGIDAAARKVLVRHQWPGNVRELEHVIERAVIVTQGPEITVEDLPDSLRGRAPRASFVLPPDHTLADLERLAILQTLERTGWNKRAAAHVLGLHRPTLYSKLRKYGIDSARTWAGAGPRETSH